MAPLAVGTYWNAIPDGDQVAYISAGSGPLTQTLSDVLQAGRYTLDFHAGRRLDLGGTWAFSTQLRAGGTPIGTVTQVDLGVPVPGDFLPAQLQVEINDTHPLLGQPLSIVVATTGSMQTNYDLFSLAFEPLIVPLTPEPSSWLLGVVCLAGLGTWSWFRRR